MRVLLISANTEQINVLPLPLGLNCIAVAARNAGHEVELLDLMFRDDFRSAVVNSCDAFHPDVIGVSVRNIDDQSMEAPRFMLDRVRDIVSLCRRSRDVPVVLGGAGFSIFPEAALNYLGAVMGIQGEGEIAFPMLLDRIGKGSSLSGIPGLHIRGKGLQGERIFTKDLDELPLPDPRLSSPSVPGQQEIWLPVQTRRGCPMNCSYCSTGTIEGRHIRRRSPGRVIENITRHVEAGFRKFYFVDSTFNLPLPYAKEICAKITESGLNISWRCILYPSRVDEEFIDLLARAGCVEVSLGFESGCDRILRNMNKRYTTNGIRNVSAVLKRFGIGRTGFLLLGGPGETRESVEESLAFAESLQLEALKITSGIRIYPGTALAESAVDDGLVSPDDDLLTPRFYMARALGEWLTETVRARASGRPHWMI